jgi:DNA-nicking Smr family endonuclease
MTRTLKPEEARLWSLVVATVRPARTARIPAPSPPSEPAATATPKHPPKFVKRKAAQGAPAPEAPRPATPAPPERIEPGRLRRIARERDPIGARLDLHGLDQDRARSALHGFIARAQEEGARAVLVITGKGTRGDGVLRRRVPEWLAEPPSRARVAGWSAADRRHGGDGALYVALKRPT